MLAQRRHAMCAQLRNNLVDSAALDCVTLAPWSSRICHGSAAYPTAAATNLVPSITELPPSAASTD